MHSRLYIHLQPLQAAENSLAAFDPSTQLFREVVEVPKPFCIRHNFNCWAEMLLRESGGKISRMLGSLENNLVGVNLLITIFTVGVQVQSLFWVQIHGLKLLILKRQRTANTEILFSWLFFSFTLFIHPYNNFFNHFFVQGHRELKPIAAYTDQVTFRAGHQVGTWLNFPQFTFIS